MANERYQQVSKDIDRCSNRLQGGRGQGCSISAKQSIAHNAEQVVRFGVTETNVNFCPPVVFVVPHTLRRKEMHLELPKNW